MIMAEEIPQATSIHARIAALNLSQVGRTPDAAGSYRPVSTSGVEQPPPLPPNRPSNDFRRNTASNPSRTHGYASRGNEPIGQESNHILPPPNIQRTGQSTLSKPKPPPPSLPARRPSAQVSPALPSQRQSEPLNRRGSTESVSSVTSGVSSISALSIATASTSTSRVPSIDGGRVRAPAYDSTTLPPLPPNRPQQKNDVARILPKTTKSSPIVVRQDIAPTPPPPLPPRLPARKAQVADVREPSQKPAPGVAKKSALSFGLNRVPADLSQLQNQGANGITNVGSPEKSEEAPPPVPLSSRPDLSKLRASKPQPYPAQPTTICLKCRDFSGPDKHAALFPRQSVPSLDWLASQLTTPFPSYTDKARAIFTWLHHNVEYDVVSFFNNAVKPSTPSSTLSTGLAVCEGYAGLFTALAVKAGLESIVITGHGMGFGQAPVPAGCPLPPESSNHAWNVVKIDNGEWKLIDSCWGAGHIGGKGQPYTKHFNPSFFTMDNNEFGLRHYPTNKNHFYRIDGRPGMSWEEYIVGDPGGERTQIYTAATTEHFLKETSFLPRYKQISVDPRQYPSSTVRFQFEKVCEHFDFERSGNGKPYCFVLLVHNQEGRRQDDYIPLETNGQFWWLDVRPESLGVPGESIMLCNVEMIDGKDARGLTKQEYLAKKGKVSSSFGGVASWDLV